MFRSCLILLAGAVSGLALTEPSSRYEFTTPRIAGHGKVVRLPYAAEQPRSESRLCVDVTTGGPPEAINPGVEKLARFVNIYAGAGKAAVDAKITVILHGQATLTALKDASYAKKLKIEKNPNLPLFRQLRDAGVELLVCGQSLAANDVRHDEIAKDIEPAVSALTVNVNRQMDGYAFIPLH